MKNTLIILLIVVFVVGGFLVYRNMSSELETPTNQMPITSGENSGPGSENLPIEPAAIVARKDLASKLSISNEKNIVILNIEERTWNDGCLGVGGPAESCLQALVPGFRVEMLAQDKTYFYRTDKTGDSVRSE